MIGDSLRALSTGGTPPGYTVDPATGRYVLAGGRSVSPQMYEGIFGTQPTVAQQWQSAFGNMANLTGSNLPGIGTPGAPAGPTQTGGQIPGPAITDKSFASLLNPSNPISAPGVMTGSTPGSVPLPTSGSGFPLDIASYLNPQEKFLQDWATHDLSSAYAGKGDLLSGDAMRGITDYAQKLAQASAYGPATATAQQQQQTGIGLGEFNQQFQNQLGLENQTIPFQQQLQLAQLGLQGAQGQSAINQMLAAILSQNAVSAGQAAGTGTVGQTNAITQAIQQALSGALGANLASNFATLFNRPIGATG